MAEIVTEIHLSNFLCIIYSMATIVYASDTETEILMPNIEAEYLTSNTTSSVMGNGNLSFYLGKHELLLSCPAYSAEPSEYKLFENNSIHVYNVTLNESLYVLKNDTAYFCPSFLNKTTDNLHKKYVRRTSYFWMSTVIGFSISMVSLLIHLIVFIIVPDLKNLPGYNLAALCSSLFCSYFFLLLIGTGKIAPYQDFCIAIAFLSHFFLLASILWMTIMSYDVFVSLLRATGSFRASSTNFTFRKFGTYCLCSFGVALLTAVASLLADILDAVPETIKPKYKGLCWFTNKTSLSIFFVGPSMALSCLNFTFFALSAFILHCNKMNQPKDDQKSLYKRRYLMYFRLSVIMGITWIVGVLANIVNVSWLWYVFVLLNTFQGFFIFIAFTCCKKVKKYFRDKYFGGRRSSEQSVTPTFVSYYSYNDSAEKDINNVVQRGKEMTNFSTIPK